MTKLIQSVVDSIDVKIDMLDRQIDVLKAERMRAVVRLRQDTQGSCNHWQHRERKEGWTDHHTGEYFVDVYCGNCNKFLSKI